MTAALPPAGESSLQEEGVLWALWRGSEDMQAREQLVLRYLPFARTLAASLYRGRVHGDIDFDEYLQWARLGLMESVDRYEPGQGAQFKTYAAHRIRGAMLNGLETASERNQQARARKRLIADRLESVKAHAQEATARHPSEADPGAGRGGAKERQSALLAYLAEVGIGIALGVMLEDTGMLVAGDEDGGRETAAQTPSPEVLYFRKTEMQHWQQQLREAMDRLAAPESRVIRYHYQQGVPFEDIAAMLGVSRSRISQLHRQGLASLRRSLGQGPPCDIFL